MDIIILGSGLIGVTTAYFLAKDGHRVTVLDRCTQSAAETSFANAGQLSYSHAEPWATPQVLPKLPFWLIDPGSPLVFRPKADPQMALWALRFLRNCTPGRAAANGAAILRLNLYSRRKMEELVRETGLAFDYGTGGILRVFDRPSELEHARRQNEFQAKFGSEERELTREQCLELEPALAHTQRTLIGGMHAFGDAYGDSFLYSNRLAEHLTERYGVRFEYGVQIQDIVAENGRVAAVKTNQGDLSADAYVMALGSYSPVYLRPIGISIPVYPMKGYSITLPANAGSPSISITDGTYKIAYSRLGDRLRVAGTAEFCGYDTAINESRIAPIVRAARSLFPNASWNAEIQKWACLRASTPGGTPVLGRTRYGNLFLNTGHGTLGWTQAAGSAALVSDIIAGRPTEISLQGFTA